MIFDSVYDTYRGGVTYIRVVDGKLTPREQIEMMSTGTKHEILEIGVVSPRPQKCDGLSVGGHGYRITGVKDVRQLQLSAIETSAKSGTQEVMLREAGQTPMIHSGYSVMSQDR